MTKYGKEVIVDIHGCDPKLFNRIDIEAFFLTLCFKIDMEAEQINWWDDVGLPPEECETEPHLKGTTGVCFIRTSNITIHTLDILKRVYLNVFSCKDFKAQDVLDFTVEWFGGEVISSHVIDRE